MVSKVNAQKHSGIILDSKLSFERRFNEKAKKGIGIIKYLSKFLPLKTLDQMYKALVRSHLYYCDIIYHIPTLNSQNNLGVTLNSLMEKVERTPSRSCNYWYMASSNRSRRTGMGDPN